VVIARGVVRAQGSPAELLSAASGEGVYLAQPGRLTTPEQIEQLAIAVGGLPGVAQVSLESLPGGAVKGLRVRGGAPGAEGDLREAIAVTAAQRGVLLTELHMVRPTLEQVFMRVTQADEPARGAA